ncbi:hypothetical protein J437_LFUL004103 [Ladona fulva]|uniref:Peptidase S1 domain-containing protein n=1 Tax=Ladona fulva TaxID=123851 RepID=A0A8K0JVS7_LADFU|nr:hypothetical protein J437_LFUL004103 [Ladona fulva]
MNERWIITAAHCAEGLPTEHISIVAGTVDYNVGGVHTGGPKISKIHYVKVKTFSDEYCKELMGDEGSPWETNICAGKAEGGIGECTGDSGGPLIIGDDGYQVGIVSWSIKPCASRNHPGVYTEIAYFIDWIRENSGTK